MINPQELKDLVENHPKLVSAKRSTRYPELRVLKYTKKVFYDNLFDTHPLLVECRGLVVDNDYNVVVKPFTKVFNHHENGTTIHRDELCTIVRKVNGFLGVATGYNGKTIFSTTGSLDSDFAVMVEKHLDGLWVPDGTTLCFEICDPSDPHIIAETHGAYLIGGHHGSDWYSESMLDWFIGGASVVARAFAGKSGFDGIYRPEWQENIHFSDVVELSKEVKHEGFMVYGQESGTVLKIKSPYYLFTKFMARMGVERLAKGLENTQELKERRYCDEEFYPVIDYLSGIREQFVAMDEQERIDCIRKFIGNAV
jgi:hypothetical protein